MGDVINLLDTKPVACGDAPQLTNWLREWTDWVEKNCALRSLVLIVETTSGEVFKVSQSTGALDGSRLLGLLESLKHRLLHGDGQPPNL